MKKYGYKMVVKFDEFREGWIVEFVNGKLMAREYIKNEFRETVQTGGEKEIDFVKVISKKTEIGKMREITKQLGHGNFVIDEGVIAVI